MKRYLVACVAVGLTVLAAACSGSEPSGDVTPTIGGTVGTSTVSATVASTAETLAAGPGEIGPIASVLSNDPGERDPAELARAILFYLPDSEETRTGVWIADYGLAARVLGLEPPDPTGHFAFAEYIRELRLLSSVDSGYFLAGFSHDTADNGERAIAGANIGIGQTDIEIGISFSDENRSRELIFGDIVPSEVIAALQGCTGCPEPTVTNYDGVDSYGWGEDFARSFSDRYADPFFDSGGRGGRLAFADAVAWRTLSDSHMEELLAVAVGQESSLTESADYVDLLSTLIDMSAVSIFISSNTVGPDDPGDALANAVFPGYTEYVQAFGFTPEQEQAFRASVIPDALPPTFDTYAVATVWDGARFRAVIAYVYPTAADAQTAVEPVRIRFDSAVTIFGEAPYSEVFKPVVSAEGRIVIVSTDARSLGRPFTESEEPFYIHE